MLNLDNRIGGTIYCPFLSTNKADKGGKPKRWTAKKLTLAERKAKVKAAKAEFLAQIEDQKE